MDKASRDRLSKVHPELAKRVGATIAALAAKGMDVRVVQGLRTYAEQNALYSQGRTRKGPKVTNAKGGFSNHNFGLAVDLCPFTNGDPDWENVKAFTAIGAAGKKAGLDWGGDWKSFPDRPHLELPTGMNTKSCRTAYEAGGLPKVWLNASSKLGLPAHVAQLKQSSATVASTSEEPETRTEGSTSDAQTLTSGNPEAQSPTITDPAQTQVAEQIINTGDVTNAPKPEDKVVSAPPPDGASSSAAKATVFGIAVPGFIYAIFKSIQDAISQGYINATEVASAALQFVQNNFKYIGAGIGVFLLYRGIKWIAKQVTLWVSMLTHAVPTWNNVTVEPTSAEPKRSWWMFWRS